MNGADAPAPRPAGRWRDLALRAASAAVMIPVALACLWVGGAAWIALVVLAAAGLAWEWMRMLRLRTYAAATMFVATLVVLALVLRGASPFTLANAVFLVGLVHLLWFRRNAPAIGAIVIAAPAAALTGLRLSPTGFENVLFLLLVVWSSDVGAYLVGRLVGGPRLAPAISPGKTWSGAAGGLIAAAIAGGVVAWAVTSRTNLHTVALAMCLGIVSQLGDLAESAVKRHCGVKDSGALIPGHGGVFDRFDGLLAAATAMALIAAVAGNGVVFWR